jgi:phosphopantetheine adenylyltransferase
MKEKLKVLWEKFIAFLKKIANPVGQLLNFNDSNGDGKIDVKEFLEQLCILIASVGYHVYAKEINDEDLDNIMQELQVECMDELKKVDFQKLLNTLIKLGIVKKK